MRFKHLLSLFLVCTSFSLFGQNFLIVGQVKDANTQVPIEGAFVTVKFTNKGTATDALGYFEISKLKAGEQAIEISFDGYETITKKVVVRDNAADIGIILLNPTAEAIVTSQQDVIPIVILSENELAEEDIANQNISGLLSASRDIFVNAAAYNLGAARFRIRGYDSENTLVYLNGVPMNELENGRLYWSGWGGLNDVTRNQEISLGLNPTSFTFGGVGGATQIDLRASKQRRQFRLSYSSSNRTYTNRLMATYSTGVLPGGWAVSLSGSRRWAQEGYIDGTFYDAWSYFVSVDKSLGENHNLNFTFLGAPNKRGRQAAATQEVYDLAGSNFHNVNWGYQQGEKRNSRVADIDQPIAILRYDWNMGERSKLTIAGSYQAGKNGSTALDWIDSKDPRPDYYQYLPSFARNRSDIRDSLALVDAFRNNPDALLVNWDEIYQSNLYGPETSTYDENGNLLFTGRQSKYILEERRFDSEEANVNLNFQSNLSSRLTFNFGGGYQYFKGSNYKVVQDLLGGEYYLDIDRFANGILAQQNDIDDPFRRVVEGDRFGYDYNVDIRKAHAWSQMTYKLPRLDLFLAANVENTEFWRTGNVRNGRFPLGDDSINESERSNFTTYGVKGGLTVKIDGRNYLYLNGFHSTRAPFARYSFTSPRTRNEVVPNLEPERITSGEVGYNFRSPYFKAKVSAYYTLFENGLFSRPFYFIQSFGNNQGAGGFFNFVSQNIDKQHLGVELAIEGRIVGGLSGTAVAAIGEYAFIDRQNVLPFSDSDISPQSPTTGYLKNFFVAGTPQEAYSVGLRYEGKGYWFANINFNYFDNIWIDFNPRRRAEDVVQNLDASTRETPEGRLALERIIFQEQAPAGYTLDFFGGKSFRIASDYFINLTVGVNNILDKKDIITGGYEQGRAEFETDGTNRFPNRYYYMFGLNYFANVTFRVNI